MGLKFITFAPIFGMMVDIPLPPMMPFTFILDMHRGNYCIREHMTSIEDNNMNPYKFVANSSQMTLHWTTLGSLELILVSN